MFYISCRRIFSPCQVIYVVMTCMLLSSCNAVKNNEYSEQEVGRSFAISFGTLLDTQEIKINGEGTIYGETGGALAVGVAGSFVGSGNGSLAGIAVGLIIGTVLGVSAEELIRDRKGLEHTVKLDSGIILAIIQEISDDIEKLSAGDRVFVKKFA